MVANTPPTIVCIIEQKTDGIAINGISNGKLFFAKTAASPPFCIPVSQAMAFDIPLSNLKIRPQVYPKPKPSECKRVAAIIRLPA